MAESPDQLTALGKYAKSVRKQLKKAYDIDVGRLSKKTDAHGQPMVIVRVGKASGEESQLWFRYSTDGGVVIDKIQDEKAAGTIKVNIPICHKRAAALISDKLNLPTDEVDLSDHGIDKEPAWPLKEDEELTEEPENFEEEFIAPTDKFAIVDASVLEGLENELADQAIIVPVKHRGTVFNVAAEYDDTILRSLRIEPAEIEQGDTEVVKTTEGTTLEGRGVAPLSHDNQLTLKTRKSLKSKNQDKGRRVPGRMPNPMKVTPKRDKSNKDERYKKRKAERPVEKRKADKMREDKVKDGADLIVSLIHNPETDLSTLSYEQLDASKRILETMLGKSELSKLAPTIKLLSERINTTIVESTVSIPEYLECLKKKRKNLISQIQSR